MTPCLHHSIPGRKRVQESPPPNHLFTSSRPRGGSNTVTRWQLGDCSVSLDCELLRTISLSKDQNWVRAGT